MTWRADAGAVARLGGLDERVLAEIDTEFELEGLTDGGRRWGVVLGARAERDTDPDLRFSAAGNCPAGEADCAALPDGRALQSPLLALRTAGGPASADDVRVSLDAGYAFLGTGWGELRLGYGEGAARLDAERGPTAFRLSRADGGRVSTSDLNHVRTENRVSGFAPKLVFRSIALGQERTIGSARLSVSWTPETEDCDVELCPGDTAVPGLVTPQAEDVLELGVHYALRRGDHEWAASLGLAQAAAGPGPAGLERLSAASAGLAWSNGPWSAGLRALASNNGVAGGGDYSAWSASAGYETGPWIHVVEYAAFSDDLVHVDGSTWQISSSRLIGERWLWGAGLQASRREEPHVTGLGRRQVEHRSTTLFTELGWQF